MTVLVIDLETVPDADLYAPPPGVEPPPFPPPWAHQIVCIGALSLTDGLGPLKLGWIGDGHDEAGMLDAFAEATARRPQLVSWNGRGFDLPVIEARALRHGVAVPFLFGRDVRDRYRGERHLDAKDHASNFGAAQGYHLDKMARLCGLPGKVGVDGSQVEAMLAEGRLEDVKRYCLSDVVQTAFVRLRQMLVAGLPRSAYVASAQALLWFVEADGRCADLVARIDRPRLLLEPNPMEDFA